MQNDGETGRTAEPNRGKCAVAGEQSSSLGSAQRKLYDNRLFFTNWLQVSVSTKLSKIDERKGDKCETDLGLTGSLGVSAAAALCRTGSAAE